MKNKKEYQPKTGKVCGCRKGIERDNCPSCEGTGMVIDFQSIRAQMKTDQEKTKNYLTQHTEDCQDANDDTSVLKGECICTHTPGPWIVGNDDDANIYDQQAGDLVAKAGNKADARLIASAPELLEALQRCRDLLLDSVNFNEGDKATTEAVSIADVVIAKAEGK